MYHLIITLTTFNPLILNCLNRKNSFLPDQKPISPVLTKTKKFTVLKSPHVNKKSREHFIYKTYKKVIKISDSNLLKLIYKHLILKTVLPGEIKMKVKYKKCL